jgi:hypothetical protein
MQHSPLIIIVVVMVASKEQPNYYEMHLPAGMPLAAWPLNYPCDEVIDSYS